jgi:hypothetical protein
MLANAGKLPDNTPIVKTGRAYHIWLQTTKQVRSQHYEGFDIKGEGGYVVAPPSIHANGNQYTFIRPLLQELPVVDFDSLVLPRVKPDYEARATTKFNPSEWKLVPGNMVDLINNGAPEGQRHNVLVSYLGALIGRGLSKELVSEYVVLWNDEKNKPPLPLVEVLSTTESCWKSYADRVSTKTHTNNYSVLIETRRAQKEKAEACQKLLEELRAKEKATELPHASMCGKRHAISRQGKKYLSVAFFCGSWNCPRCANYFRTRWLNHLGEVTNGSILFITNIVSRDWDCFRRRLNRAGCEYVRIYDYGHSTVITNKAVPGSNPIPEGQLAERLEALIPHKFEFSPVSTSRGWQLEKKVKDPEKETATLVTRTFLPIDVQQAIAKQLGATLDGERRWVSPENEDAQEWENKFTSELAKHEAHIWSETVKKKKSLEGWVDDFNKVMEAEDVFDGHRERWEVIAG